MFIMLIISLIINIKKVFINKVLNFLQYNII